MKDIISFQVLGKLSCIKDIRSLNLQIWIYPYRHQVSGSWQALPPRERLLLPHQVSSSASYPCPLLVALQRDVTGPKLHVPWDKNVPAGSNFILPIAKCKILQNFQGKVTGSKLLGLETIFLDWIQLDLNWYICGTSHWFPLFVAHLDLVSLDHTISYYITISHYII